MTPRTTPGNWDEQFRREVKDGFVTSPSETAKLNEIRFEGEYPDFGFHWSTGGWLQSIPEYYADDPESLATMLRINFNEAVVVRVPRTPCTPGAVAWIN